MFTTKVEVQQRAEEVTTQPNPFRTLVVIPTFRGREVARVVRVVVIGLVVQVGWVQGRDADGAE